MIQVSPEVRTCPAQLHGVMLRTYRDTELADTCDVPTAGEVIPFIVAQEGEAGVVVPNHHFHNLNDSMAGSTAKDQ